VPHLRHEDAAGRQLLRLRGLRLNQRLQLETSGVAPETAWVNPLMELPKRANWRRV
jgi:hypothetical protein